MKDTTLKKITKSPNKIWLILFKLCTPIASIFIFGYLISLVNFTDDMAIITIYATPLVCGVLIFLLNLKTKGKSEGMTDIFLYTSVFITAMYPITLLLPHKDRLPNIYSDFDAYSMAILLTIASILFSKILAKLKK